ncbi:uncharacterized protein SPSK_02609 [Sporothrix schenckii 1099-18]|uniref:Calcineurin-like phosphoesterase domain-containing protein n=2 Tax=Sporothrix schenckii TaxID=29908 RepID=U7PN37_SPOS1|nr:uncharacterized protein SPSK_02609 [Sporothrix schenckii 1099-18]ERS96987.1 hypothetical protein HMPREF1624_06314 [Sporothrix schenckii ATCC 58251]KJR86179.1 hypothetical protein SPSK_02609 [Sporothrix schenckii 1099-18]
MKAFSKLANRLSLYKKESPEPTPNQPTTTSAQPSPPQVDGPIHVLSDLHLEICSQYSTFKVPKTSAAYLILAGDIGRLVDYAPLLGFLEGLVSSYRRIFYVLGNHEFYTLTYEKGLSEAHRLEKEPSLNGKVTILHRTRWDEDAQDSPVPSLTVLGCTLWTHVPPESRDVVGHAIRDFQYIEDWTVDSHNQMHNEEVAWLRQQVAALRTATTAAAAKRTVVVVTHHVPTVEGTSRPKYAGSLWASAFTTELILPGSNTGNTGHTEADGGRVADDTKPWEGVAAWIYGHTHYSNDFVRGGVRLIANQRGPVFPPNPDIFKAEDAAGADKTGQSGKSSFRIIERKAHQDEGKGLHAFNPARTIAL